MKGSDRSGEKHNMLTLISKVDTGTRPYYVCLCDCGNYKNIAARHIFSGKTKSCGCFRIAFARDQFKRHGLTGTKVYRAWLAIYNRCYNKNIDVYRHYGGRGIRVCDRWLNSFDNFLSDMGHPPSKKHSIERDDNDGHYTPENCRWATMHEQCRNRRNSRLLTYKGQTMILQDWAKHLGIHRRTLSDKLKKKSISQIIKENKNNICQQNNKTRRQNNSR